MTGYLIGRWVLIPIILIVLIPLVRSILNGIERSVGDRDVVQLQDAEAHAAYYPDDIDNNRQVWRLLWRLAEAKKGGVTWAHVAHRMRDMKSRGALDRDDAPYLSKAEQRASKGA